MSDDVQVTIEVCERLMDRQPNGNPMYHAKAVIGSHDGPWGSGRTRDEAIGSLVLSHPELFGIDIKVLGKLPR